MDDSPFTYLTDADNLARNWKRGRSGTERVNSLLLLISEACIAKDLHLRVVRHSRRVPLAKLADLLSRGDVQGYRASSRTRNPALEPSPPAFCRR